VPILNVSDVEASFAWFGKLGWFKQFERDADDPAAPPNSAGCDGCEIFLCRDGHGSSGRGANTQAGGPGVDQRADKGAGYRSGSMTSTRCTRGA
jgi:hypothetical protein